MKRILSLILFLVLLSMTGIAFAVIQAGPAPKNSPVQKETADLIPRLFVLKYADADETAAELRGILSKDGNVESLVIESKKGDGKAGAMVFVRDTAEVIAEAEKFIATIDIPVPLMKVTLNYSNAPLLDVLRSLSDDTHLNIVAGKDVSGTVTVHLVDVPLDSALNSILLSNGYTYVREGSILRVMPYLAPKEEALNLVTEMFNLKYVGAEDIKASLEKFLSKDGLIQVFSRRDIVGTKSKADILIVRDSLEIVQNIASIIKKIDKQLPQVLIEVKFLNVQLDKSDKSGVDWVIKATLAGSKIPTTLPFKNDRTNFDKHAYFVPSLNPTGTDFASDAIFPFAATGNFTFGSLNFTETQIVLELLEKRDNTKIISSPRVAVMHGQEAMINIGENYPIPQYTFSKETGTQYISGYDTQKIGIILRVTPYVEDGGQIRLTLHPEVSEITSFIGPNSERPVSSTKEVVTDITIPNGNTIIMGGLIKEADTVKDHSFPVLGHIPLLKRIFSYKSKVNSRTELMIFVTPHIINEAFSITAPDEERYGAKEK